MIEIYKIIESSRAIESKDGDMIYKYVKDKMELNNEDDELIFDFSNLDVITTTFLNSAIGKIIINVKGKKILFKNIKNRLDANMLRLVVSNAYQKGR